MSAVKGPDAGVTAHAADRAQRATLPARRNVKVRSITLASPDLVLANPETNPLIRRYSIQHPRQPAGATRPVDRLIRLRWMQGDSVDICCAPSRGLTSSEFIDRSLPRSGAN